MTNNNNVIDFLTKIKELEQKRIAAKYNNSISTDVLSDMVSKLKKNGYTEQQMYDEIDSFILIKNIIDGIIDKFKDEKTGDVLFLDFILQVADCVKENE